jgi:multiple sugar transport system permease protein
MPNLLGFLVFTLVPLVFSMVLAFSNWDLKLHNQYKNNSIHFIGLDNFIRLINEPNFWKFLGNTLYLMLLMPFAIAASLIAAILLSKDLRGGSRRMWATLLLTAIMVGSLLLLMATGQGRSGMVIMMASLVASIFIGGALGGQTVYRTLFYIPNFTAGVATMLLWKHLFNPQSGPINSVLRGPLVSLTDVVRQSPSSLIQSGLWVSAGLIALGAWFGLRRLRKAWSDGDYGSNAVILSAVFLILPAVLAIFWSPVPLVGWVTLAATVCVTLWQLVIAIRGRDFHGRPWDGVGSSLMTATSLMSLQLVVLGLGIACYHLPAMAAVSDGLTPPNWLTDYDWAKPAMMLMGFWGAIGSNNMLLYLAALTNVPQELYEAADIDGATRLGKFWNITWPQLAPTTFFIVVMGVISGLQGGFEQARVMTQGGPAGSTTTLSYMIYSQGFEIGRLGYASAVSWMLFAMVLVITLFNWKFGNKYVND